MKVLIAIDSFKGSLSSTDCSKAISEGIKEVYKQAEVVTVPLADGGEGTVEALVTATNGEFVKKIVTGPTGRPVEAVYGIFGNGKTAVIEVAAACGLPLITGSEANPCYTTTFGVGQLILDAMDKGCRNFVVGLGGSATNDAGIGMLQALGYSFRDRNHQEVEYGGLSLREIETIDRSNVHYLLNQCTFKVACDVNNPLFGKNGAAYIYGPQKGATAEMVEVLDAGLEHFANMVYREVNRDLQNIAGAGAAGGLGAAFAGFLNGSLLSGIDIVLKTVGLEDKIKSSAIVITGEGKLDEQTSMGKAPLGVAQISAKYGIPVIALAGGMSEQAFVLNDFGVTSLFSITNGPMTLQEAMDRNTTYMNLKMTTKQLFRFMKAVNKVE